MATGLEGLLFIFFARVADVSLSTIRTQLIFRGRPVIAAVLGFFEVSLYVVALSLVVRTLDNPLYVVVYALGFASGSLLGAWIEERLAIGYATLQVIPREPSERPGEAVAAMREQGFGVTTVMGEGLQGPRPVHIISLPRRALPRALRRARELWPTAFITVMDTRGAYGGILPGRKRK